MKGVVFRELLEMIDDRFGPDVTERVLDACALPSGGAYTAVGTYDHAEVLMLVSALAQETGAEGRDLVRTFGRHLFHRLVQAHPATVHGHTDALGFVATIHDHIHVAVRKLYPDAELPDIGWRTVSENEVELTYHSSRPFADLCQGLIEGSVEYFGVPTEVTRAAQAQEDLHSASFRLQRAA